MKLNKDMVIESGGVLLIAVIPAFMILRWLSDPFGPAEVIQSRAPLSLAETRKRSGLPFPDVARNIRFASFHEGIGYAILARFEAPVEDCVAFSERVIADAPPRDKAPSVGLSPFEGPVDRSVVQASQLDTTWFDVQAIGHGFVGGGGPSHSPKVWIDTERGVCYFIQHD